MIYNQYLTGIGSLTSTNAYPFRKKLTSTKQVWVNVLLVLVFILAGAGTSNAQFTSTWSLIDDGTNVVAGPQAANITAGVMSPFNIVGTGAHNANGYGIQTTRANWATAPSDDFRLDFPIAPAPGFDIQLTTLTFRSRTSGGSGNSAVSISYQEDGAGPWIPITANPAFPHLFNGSSTNYSGALSTTFTSGHTYVIRMYVYWATSGSSANTNRTNTIGTVVMGGNTVVSGPAPTVTTTGSSAVTRSTATASGDITPVSSAVTESGIAWGTTANPDISGSHLATSPLVSSGPFSVNITGLLAGQLYHYRAYATNGVGTSYGADLIFTTDAAVLATVTTTAATGITAISAATGGNISDDGGAPVTLRGVVWNTTGSPVIPADANTTNGTGAGAFNSAAQILLPATTYFLRAYAVTTAGTAYGNEISFTTAAATPTIVVTPDSLAFGTVLQGTTSANQSYTIAGYFLEPAAGNINIAAPAGYQVSTSATGGFANSLLLPYTTGTLSTTTIYVRFSPSALANYNKNIVNSGGGAPAVNVRLAGAIDPVGGQGQQGFSNKGKDFWVGYGASEKMTSDNSQDLRFTFNNPNPVAANITISIPNQPGFAALNYTVPPNGIITTNSNEIPEGLDPNIDARLRSEGVFNSGIHIVSDQPIVAYAHNVTSQVYAASVLFPTPTLGREYISLNFTQRFNSSSSANRSYCFAIATEDNTLLEVVLPPGVATQNQAAGTTFTQLLNKGEILNLFGASTGSETAIDLSGVIVRSLSGTTGCKPFAFFCGSGKISIDCSTNSNVSVSGDNLFQQMFPKVAWGYKYITVPTQPATMNINHFRVLVDNPAAVVTRNGTPLTGLVNNAYYEYLNTEKTVDVIESDKPIMVAQYMTSKSQCGNASGSVGDPEMIYLSSVQQTIDTVSLVSSPLGNSSNRSHFINVTTKTADAADFRLDGAAVVFTPVANDPAFSYAQIPVGETSHTMTSPRGFNAIAYGVAGDESYGYNAGTNLVDLLSGFNVQNQYASGISVAACRGSEFYMRVTLAFRATSILWDFAANPNLVPSSSITETNPVPEDSVVINGVMLYIYKLATPFIYNALGSFDVKVVANNPTPDGCDGNKTFTFPINVGQGPVADFSFSSTLGCLLPIQFTDASTGNGGSISGWNWTFGDASSDSVQNPLHTYTSGGTFSVKLRAITAEGCYDDSVKVLTFSGVPAAGFSYTANGCVNVAQTFTDTSKVTSGTITAWNWNFGDGTPGAVVNATNGNAQTYTYAAPGNYTVTLTVVTSTGCTSAVFSQQVNIAATPTVSFAAVAGVCNTNAAFVLTGGSPASVTGVGTGVYSGTGVVNGNFDPAVAGVGTHTITYTYTTAAGCTGTATQTIAVSQSAALSITAVPVLCTNSNDVTLVPSIAGGVFTGTGITGNVFSSSAAGAGTFTIGYSIPSNPCTVPATLQVTVNPGPADFSAGRDVDGIFGRTNNLEGTGSATNTYLWSPSTGLASATSLVTTSTATVTTTYTLTATNSFGCTATDDVVLTISKLCIDPPKVFTPNGDGFYDKWIVVNGSCTKEVQVSVYNRWGGLVYSNDRYTNTWDGTHNGKALPDGTYYYVVKALLVNGGVTQFKGNVTIMR